MFNATEGLSPLAAYEELMHFARKRGEAALRLALHASVPQDLQPELLHLIKRNFVPEAADDPSIEVDVLFAPFCEEMGRGYFRFDQQVRTLLLDNLASNYSAEPVSRIYRVANFLLFYVDHFERNTAGRQDQLWKDYLEIQRWVALAFIDPEGAARQLAAALKRADANNDFATRIQLGGLASALSAPLIGHRRLLNYAAGLQALELGDRQKAESLLGSLKDDEIKVGNVTLRPASKVMADWHARNPGISPPPVERATDVEQAPAETEQSTEDIEQPLASSTIEEMLAALLDTDDGVRRRAFEALRQASAVVSLTVSTLAELLKDKDRSMREAAVRSLGEIGNEEAVYALVDAVDDESYGVSMAVIDELVRIEAGAKNFVLIIDSYTIGEAELLEEIKRRLRQRSFTSESAAVEGAATSALRGRNYRPVILDFWKTPGDWLASYISRLSPLVRFIIIDLFTSEEWLPDMQSAVSELSIPIQPIADESTPLSEKTRAVLEAASALPIYRYRDRADLLLHFEQRVMAPLEAKISEMQEPVLSGLPAPETARPPVSVPNIIPERPRFPAFEHDVYLSYAHQDNEPSSEHRRSWVDTFQKALSNRLGQFMGREPRIWRDTLIQRSDYFNDSTIDVVRTSAIFVAVISPRYVNSEWCAQELRTFISESERTGGLAVGIRSRIIKVLKTPVPIEKQLPLLREAQGYEFYEMRSVTGYPVEFQPELGGDQRQKFLVKLEELAWDIAGTLRAIKKGEGSYQGEGIPVSFPARSPEGWAEANHLQYTKSQEASPSAISVYLAEVTPDLRDGRDRIMNELLARGYRVLPGRPIRLNDRELKRLVDDDLRQCSLSIHLLGSQYGRSSERHIESVSELQYKSAVERARDSSFSCIVWMPPGLEVTDARQKRFISEVEDASHVELLESSLEELKTVVVRRLQRAPLVAPAVRGLKTIYLIDTSQDEDATLPIERYLLDAGFEVIRNPKQGDGAELLQRHKAMLSRCDAVLIYYGKASHFWLNERLADLQKAPGWGRSRPFSAKAVYVAGPDTPQKLSFDTFDALVIRNFEEFYPESLGPLMAALSFREESGDEPR